MSIRMVSFSDLTSLPPEKAIAALDERWPASIALREPGYRLSLNALSQEQRHNLNGLMLRSCQQGHTELADYLLRRGLEPSGQQWLSVIDGNHEAIFDLLIPRFRRGRFDAALVYAAFSSGRVKMARELIARGASDRYAVWGLAEHMARLRASPDLSVIISDIKTLRSLISDQVLRNIGPRDLSYWNAAGNAPKLSSLGKAFGAALAGASQTTSAQQTVLDILASFPKSLHSRLVASLLSLTVTTTDFQAGLGLTGLPINVLLSHALNSLPLKTFCKDLLTLPRSNEAMTMALADTLQHRDLTTRFWGEVSTVIRNARAKQTQLQNALPVSLLSALPPDAAGREALLSALFRQPDAVKDIAPLLTAIIEADPKGTITYLEAEHLPPLSAPHASGWSAAEIHVICYLMATNHYPDAAVAAFCRDAKTIALMIKHHPDPVRLVPLIDAERQSQALDLLVGLSP